MESRRKAGHEFHELDETGWRSISAFGLRINSWTKFVEFVKFAASLSGLNSFLEAASGLTDYGMDFHCYLIAGGSKMKRGATNQAMNAE